MFRQAMGIVALVIIPAVVGSQDFEFPIWPSEGRPLFVAGSDELSLRRSPSKESPVKHIIHTKAGTPVSFTETRYRTVRAGRFVVLKKTVFSGRIYGELKSLSLEEYYSDKFKLVDIEISSGDALEFLQYRAEGTCFVRYQNQVIGADLCLKGLEDRIRLQAPPEVEWWIRAEFGESAGWLLVGETEAKLTGRTF